VHAVGQPKISLALNLAVELPRHPMAAADRTAMVAHCRALAGHVRPVSVTRRCGRIWWQSAVLLV